MNNYQRKYYIFRHGETFVTKGLRLNYGTKIFTADILDEGKPALQKLGRYLNKVDSDFNASSRFKRCRQTVSIVSEASGKNFEFDSRLNEFFFELPFFFKRRISRFLNELNTKNYHNVIICTHGANINEIIKLINPKAFGQLARKTPDPRPALQLEASRKSLQLENKLTFTKYLSPAVLLILTTDSVQEINFNLS